MTAQQHLKAAVRTIVGPWLRGHGFRGSGDTWVKRVENGDRAVVNVQSSQFSTAEDVRCVLNLAVVPAPWWVWRQAEMPNNKFTTPKEYHRLWRSRLHPADAPAGPDVWWIVTDEQSANAAAREMTHRLEAAGIPSLERLLDRARLLATLREVAPGWKPGFGNTDRALAILLADEGASEDLSAVLARLVTGGEDDSWGLRFAVWTRQRAASRACTVAEKAPLNSSDESMSRDARGVSNGDLGPRVGVASAPVLLPVRAKEAQAPLRDDVVSPQLSTGAEELAMGG